MLKIKNILISQPKPENDKSPYFAIAEKYNVNINFRPFIKVAPIELKDFLIQKIDIKEFQSIVFTSKIGIEHFFRMIKDLKIKLSDDLRYFCLTEAFAFYLQKFIDYRKRKVVYPNTGKMQDLFDLMHRKEEDEKFLFILPENIPDEISDLLSQTKLKFNIAKMYRSVSNDFEADEKFDYDMVIFFSPYGIGSLTKNVHDFQQNDIHFGCLGASAAKAVREAGFRVDLEVPNPKYSSITLALDEYLKNNHKGKK